MERIKYLIFKDFVVDYLFQKDELNRLKIDKVSKLKLFLIYRLVFFNIGQRIYCQQRIIGNKDGIENRNF